MTTTDAPAATPPETAQDTPLETALRYHARTRHGLQRLARYLGYLDWANQPDPFRRFAGAPLLPLAEVPPEPLPPYDALYDPRAAEPAPLTPHTVAQLCYDSLALSAWKAYGTARWSLRVNPSSGNLHPTEGYLLLPAAEGLSPTPAVYHYAPREHALEERRPLTPGQWAALTEGLPAGALLFGFTSIPWRESWKYGERAFRYCQHDMGHALAAVSLAAALLGYEARLLPAVPDAALGVLLGVHEQTGPEAEWPEALLLLAPAGALPPAETLQNRTLPDGLLEELRAQPPQGEPNRLSAEHHPWPIIETVAAATAVEAAPLPTPAEEADAWRPEPPPPWGEAAAGGARQIVRRRRSAVDMDGFTPLPADAFYRTLAHTLPRAGVPPLASLPWRPALHMGLFVNRVQGLAPGLYVLVRNPADEEALRAAFHADFRWERPPGCPSDLPLYLLNATEVAEVAAVVSCRQAIAANGAYALGMIGRFGPALAEHGAPHYRRLHWEAGAIGQVLYLETEAAGLRSTGIGCFFDDVMHEVFGIADTTWQTLYHFTAGGAVDDPRLRTEPAYAHLKREG